MVSLSKRWPVNCPTKRSSTKPDHLPAKTNGTVPKMPLAGPIHPRGPAAVVLESLEMTGNERTTGLSTHSPRYQTAARSDLQNLDLAIMKLCRNAEAVSDEWDTLEPPESAEVIGRGVDAGSRPLAPVL